MLKEDEYKIRQYPDFDEYEKYLLDLDELDIHLIRKARDYTEKNKQQPVNVNGSQNPPNYGEYRHQI
ncbi:MAG: hypothetical protein GQ529_10175 [Methyloprofundus sp.]|nr:hypothetical protein [Methyloprofundus sp.]